LGEARGVALLASIQAKVSVFEYATREVKQALTGYGQATKDQIQKMVKSMLKLPEVAQEDASDALAVAICHLQSYKMRAVAG
jgi:crossover junction endodeoxyribonuclease RuvC